MLSLRYSGVVVVRSLTLVTVVVALSLAVAGCSRQQSGTRSGVGEETASANPEGTTGLSRAEALAKQYPFERITTRQMFDRLVRDADKPVVVIFVSRTCAVCKKIGERLKKLPQDFGDSVAFYVVDEPAAMEIVMEMQVHTFPTVHLFSDGRKVNEWHGLNIGGLRAELNRLVEKE